MDDLKSLLQGATADQLEPLVVLLDTNHCQYSSPDEIIRGIQWLHRNIFESVHREVSGKTESYADVLCTLLAKLGVAACPELGCEYLEGELSRKVFESMWASFTSTQRLDFENTVEEALRELGKSKEWLQVGGITGAMLAAKLSGFGTYMLASSAISAVGGTVGATLPFGVYKAVSSAIGLVLGPIGWIGLTVFGLYKLTGTNYAKLVPCALYISMLRYELALRPNKILGQKVIPHDYPSKRGLRLL